MKLPTAKELESGYRVLMNGNPEHEEKTMMPFFELCQKEPVLIGALNGFIDSMNPPGVNMPPGAKDYIRPFMASALVFGLSLGLYIGERRDEVRIEAGQDR